jgi:hypothetical protein
MYRMNVMFFFQKANKNIKEKKRLTGLKGTSFASSLTTMPQQQ